MVSRGAVADLLKKRRVWPVDIVILSYFAVLTLLELIYWTRIPEAGELVGVHLAGMLLIGSFALLPHAPILDFLHHWYPLPAVFYSYKEMSILIPGVRSDADAALARLDFALWGVNPTVWLER